MRFDLDSPIMSALDGFKDNGWNVDYRAREAGSWISMPNVPKSIRCYAKYVLHQEKKTVAWSFIILADECGCDAAQPFLSCLGGELAKKGLTLVRESPTCVSVEMDMTMPQVFRSRSGQGVMDHLGVIIVMGASFMESCAQILNRCHAHHLAGVRTKKKLPSPHTLTDYCIMRFADGPVQYVM